MNYNDQLKHPNWQKKRLEILNRDSFQCVLCKDKDTQLHVHHKTYSKGKLAWEYSNENFISLCSDCHLSVEYVKPFCCKIKKGLKEKTIKSGVTIVCLVAHDLDGNGPFMYRLVIENGIVDWCLILNRESIHGMLELFND